MFKLKIEKVFKEILNSIFPRKEEDAIIQDMNIENLQKIADSKNVKNYKIISLFNYKNPLIKKLIWNIKYKGCIKSTKKTAEVLYPYLVDEIARRNMFGEKDIPILVPIPLFKKRERERGFNQSERICKILQKIDGNRSFSLKNNILKRVIDTKSQTKMKSRKEREENIRNAFEVINKESVENKVIILIDDVITTNATMREARKTLLKSGAKDVISFALARG